MLLKRYRYILFAKIILLIGGTILLWMQPPDSYTGGTLLIIHDQNRSVLQDPKRLENFSLPRSVVEVAGTGYTIHVPRTYDTGYVETYLSGIAPPRNTSVSEHIYTDACRLRVIINDTLDTRTCQMGPILPVWLPWALVLLGLIL